MSASRFNAVIDQLESGVIPSNRIFHTRFKDMVSDTMAVVEAMHRHFDIPLGEEGRNAIRQYLIDHPRDARPAHRFNPGSDEAVAKACQAYKRYQEYFDIPSE